MNHDSEMAADGTNTVDSPGGTFGQIGVAVGGYDHLLVHLINIEQTFR